MSMQYDTRTVEGEGCEQDKDDALHYIGDVAIEILVWSFGRFEAVR